MSVVYSDNRSICGGCVTW